MARSSPPSSPRIGSISISDCIHELMKFILSSSMDKTLETDLGFSAHYCSNLLADEPDDDRLCRDDVADTYGGVPPYPLYKRLASSLHRCITSGSFLRASKAIKGIREDESLKQKEIEWNMLIADKGSDLSNILKAVDFEIHVQEPFFSQLIDGLKTIEGRCAVGGYNRIVPGALLLVNKCLLLEVQLVSRYPSFAKMMEAEGIIKILPSVKTIEEGVQIYRKFYSEEKEMVNGVLAICVSRVVDQPYRPMASILLQLGYSGMGNLLGLVQTEGTVTDALPPPRYSLLSSFEMPNHPNVEGGSTLTQGARALAKHTIRSSDGWWGSFCGNDNDKNELALKVICHLITHCCWMNMHIIQPHGCVLEIRVAEGYGARWSKDGSKFIGFLEPYMEDGFSKGWKH